MINKIIKDWVGEHLGNKNYIGKHIALNLEKYIPQLTGRIEKEIAETILKSFEELNQSDYPMAIIHWSKKDREDWIINTLKGGKEK